LKLELLNGVVKIQDATPMFSSKTRPLCSLQKENGYSRKQSSEVTEILFAFARIPCGLQEERQGEPRRSLIESWRVKATAQFRFDNPSTEAD